MRKCGETLGTCLGTREGAGKGSRAPFAKPHHAPHIPVDVHDTNRFIRMLAVCNSSDSR